MFIKIDHERKRDEQGWGDFIDTLKKVCSWDFFYLLFYPYVLGIGWQTMPIKYDSQ